LRNKVVDLKDLRNQSSLFRGKNGKWLAALFMRVFAMERVNKLYERSCNHTGAGFAESLLKDMGVEYLIGNSERLNHLPDGAFITISNHPYGGLDGIMLIDLMVEIRSDYKLMVNQVLSLVKTMDENFISVKPKVGNKSSDPKVGINGIRQTLNRLQEGHPVGFFPAGAVSMFRFKYMGVRDREWQESLIKLIQFAKVPVLPIRFFNKNSLFFYFLGILDWRIRMIRMPYELFNKQKHKSHIGIGKIISVEELSVFSDSKSLGKFLQESIYDMPKPTSFISKADFKLSSKNQ